MAILANQAKRRHERLKKKYSRVSGNRLLYLNLSQKLYFYIFISSNANDLDILQIAIELASKKTLNVYGKAMLEEMVKEDQRYFDLLQIEYMVRSKFKKNNADEEF